MMQTKGKTLAETVLKPHMKTTFKVTFLIIILVFSSCKEKTNKTNFQKIDNINYQTVEIESDTLKSQKVNIYFKEVIENPKTPELAKMLLNNYASNSEEPLEYFSKLKSNEKVTREFYFKVLTNTNKYADGSYAEGLGNYGKEYIEENTKVFLTYFDNKTCFNDKDLETWADIAMLEFSLLIENTNESEIVEKYIKKLNEILKNLNKIYDDFLKILDKKD